MQKAGTIALKSHAFPDVQQSHLDIRVLVMQLVGAVRIVQHIVRNELADKLLVPLHVLLQVLYFLDEGFVLRFIRLDFVEQVLDVFLLLRNMT